MLVKFLIFPELKIVYKRPIIADKVSDKYLLPTIGVVNNTAAAIK